MRLHGEALKQRNVVGGLHQHDVGVELPRLVKLEFEDGTRAIRTRKLRTVWMFNHCLFQVPAGTGGFVRLHR